MTIWLKQVSSAEVAKNEMVLTLGWMNRYSSVEVFANKCFANARKRFSNLLTWVDKIQCR